MRALAVLLHGMGGMGFGMTGRVLGVSGAAVLKWVRAGAASLPGPVPPSSVVTAEVDEMRHVLNRSLPSPGCGGALGVAGLWV